MILYFIFLFPYIPYTTMGNNSMKYASEFYFFIQFEGLMKSSKLLRVLYDECSKSSQKITFLHEIINYKLRLKLLQCKT